MKVKIRSKFKKLLKKTKNHFRKKYLIWVVIATLIIFVYLIYCWGYFIESRSGAIQALSTIILVIITGIYAYFTQQNVNLFKKQLTSKIKLEIKEFRKENCDEERLKELKKILQGDGSQSSANIIFSLEFFIKNKYAGSGSIELPNLCILFQSKVIKLEPENIREIRGSDHTGYYFYLKGGEKRAYKSEYIFRASNIEDQEKVLKFIDNYNEIKFKIKYKNSNDSVSIKEISSKKINTVKRNNVLRGSWF